MNKNISSVHDCYGCGVCATACGRKIIEINLNDDGFMNHILQMRADVLIVVFVQKYVPISMKICHCRTRKSILMQHGVKII